jgi:hypothetical protein
MAGPYHLKPGQTQGGIPTWAGTSQTKVLVTNNDKDEVGKISMTAGGSPTEFDDVPHGTHTFSRAFGGVQLAVKNEGKVELTVETQ